MYMILQVSEKVCQSKNWGDASDGANIGLAGFATFIMALLNPHLTQVSFAWHYGLAVVALFAIRNSLRSPLGCCAVYGFGAEMSFGLSGIYFKRCFLESMKGEEARENFHRGFCVGVITLVLIFLVLYGFWEYISYSQNR